MNTETGYQIFAIAVFSITMTISITYRHRAARAGDRISVAREEGTLLMALRSLFGLSLWLGTLAYLIRPEWMAWAQGDLPAWLRWLGGAVMLACVPLVYWLFSSLGKNVTHTVAIRKEHTLVTTGPYRWVRHPLYSTGFLMFLGFSLLAASWFFPLVIAGGAVILNLRTDIEEQRLMEKFGDEYREYMQRTGRYLPRWKTL